MRCFWKVRVWDQDGSRSAWSEPALWTMGLLKPDEWGGFWIGADEPVAAPAPWFPGAQWIWYPEGNPRENAPLGHCYFLCDFELPDGGTIASADLYSIADGRCADEWKAGRRRRPCSNRRLLEEARAARCTHPASRRPQPASPRSREHCTHAMGPRTQAVPTGDRKSTRLNSSHRCISYAVFCLK